MDLFTIVGVVIGAFVLLMVSMRVLIVLKIRKQKGKPAPKLEGARGKAMKRDRNSLFYFYSPKCGACRTMTPLVKQLSESNDGVFSVDISQDMATARAFGVMATPTTVIVKAGIVEDILVGPQPPARLKAILA